MPSPVLALLLFGLALSSQTLSQTAQTQPAPARAIVLHAAKLLGWEGEIGALEPGYFADIIAVAGNPLEDVGTLKNVSFVMKGGVVYKK